MKTVVTCISCKTKTRGLRVHPLVRGRNTQTIATTGSLVSKRDNLNHYCEVSNDPGFSLW